MLKQIRIIAGHELTLTIATRRALAAVLLYLVTALLGGIGYVKSLNAMQHEAMHLLSAKGGAPAAAETARLTRQAYEQLVVFLAGTDGAPVAQSLTDSMIVPAFLWGSLAFLPFLVVLTSFDMISSDLQTRSLCYSVLRAPRLAILLGKLLAQALLFIGLSVLASLALIGIAMSLLDQFELGMALPGLIRAWVVLLPYAFCYLGLATLCSTSLRQPAVALLAALGLMIALRIFGLFTHVPEGHAFSALRSLRWLSPSQYQSGLWEAGFAAPAFSAFAYLCFGAGFTLLASRVLEGRDL